LSFLIAEVHATAPYLLAFMFAQAAAVLCWRAGGWGTVVFVTIFSSQGAAAELP